ncbi:MAG: HU family DNA-binding protein [candidate division WOR-3 bacterium]
MNKAELVSNVRRKTGLTKKDVDKVITTVFAVLGEAFERRERVELRGFGVFEVKKYRPRRARNPQTQESVQIPSRWVVFFRPSKSIKERL